MTIPGEDAAKALVGRLGVSIDPELLVLSLTHRSFAYEAGGLPTNERLEFLGDSVLGIGNHFVLNTQAMPAAALSANSLQAQDSALSDHWMRVADFRPAP